MTLRAALILLTCCSTLGFGAEVNSPLPMLRPDVEGVLGAIPIEVNSQTKRAILKAAVNGVEGRFLVDTGLSDTILDTQFAGKAGVSKVEVRLPIVAGNYGNRGDTVAFVRVPDMEIAGTHFRNFHAVMQDAQRPRRDFTGRLDGVVGANVLFAKPLTLDYRRQRLTFASEVSRPHDFVFDFVRARRKTAPAEKIREVSSRTAAIDAEIDGVKVLLMLDSGAAIGDTILINEPYHAAFRELGGDPTAGQYIAKEVRADGKLLLTRQRCLLRPFAETVIGSVFFERHVITVDMAAGKIMIDRNP